MKFTKGQTVYWLGLSGVVEQVDDFGIQVNFLEFHPKFNKAISRWMTFNEDGTYLTGQREGLTTIQGYTATEQSLPDYDLTEQLNELDSKLSIVLDSIEELAEKQRGNA
jgi:hypothetical protein